MQSDEPTIITSLEAHLEEYGHETVGQDIAAAILVIRDLHAKAALPAADPVMYVSQRGVFCTPEFYEGIPDSSRKNWQPLYAAPPALTAQVQDVAGDPDALFWRIRVAYLRGAEWRDQNGSMELAEKASYDYADKMTSPLTAAPAKQEG